MAATVDSTSNAGALAASSASWAHTLGGGSNLVLVVLIGSAWSPAIAATAVTYGAQNLSLVTGSRIQNAATVDSECWRLADGVPPSGNQTIQVTMSTTCELYCGAIVAKGANQTTALGTAATNSGSGTGLSVTVTSGTDELSAAATVGSISGSETIANNAGTQHWNLTNGPGTSLACGASIAGSASAAHSWTVSPTSAIWTASGVSIKAAVSGTWKTTLGLAIASIKTVTALAKASIKTMQGLTP